LLEQGDLANARHYFDTSLQIAEKIQHKSMILDNYAHLRDWYLLQKDFQQAEVFNEKYRSGMDSVFSTQMAEKIADSQTRYETEKKEAEIATQRLALLNQRLWIFGLAGGLIALVVLGLLLYNRYRQRQKAELAAALIREQKLGLNAVIEAQESERKRIAKDLHDGIAQELVALKLGFNALGRRISRLAPDETARFAELDAQLDASCTEVRNIAHIMLPPALEQRDLAQALEMLLHSTTRPAGLRAQFQAGDLPDDIDEKARIGLYRILQELLNNVVKHARAGNVQIQLSQSDNRLQLRVEDDGQGFDFEAARNKGTMGVLNILSRVSTLGGEFRSEARQPQGTVSIVTIPAKST
jgi:signal transduction histidine kinase